MTMKSRVAMKTLIFFFVSIQFQLTHKKLCQQNDATGILKKN